MTTRGKLFAVSDHRYRASADERRRYGGTIVTVYLIGREDENGTTIPASIKRMTGYGRTQHDRKRDAIARYERWENEVQAALNRLGSAAVLAALDGKDDDK